MKRIAALFAGAVAVASLVAPAHAQNPDVAAQVAAQQEAEERYKRLNSTVEALAEGQAAQQKRIAALAEEIHNVAEEARRGAAGAVTRDELRKLAEAVAELDRQRQADKDLILGEIKKLGSTLAAPPPRPPVKEKKTADEPTTELPAKWAEYTVKDGDTLSGIIAEYRKNGVKVTLAAVQKANPKLDPNRMRVGQKIVVPLPE